MTTRILLSIVIPCLNEAHELPATLIRLERMRKHGVEVIVVDGGSNDGTTNVACSKADIVLTAPRGRALQMNVGAAKARGDVLLFLHADSHLPEGADDLIVEGLARSVCSWGRFDINISGQHPMLPVIANAINLRSRLTRIATGDQAIFVRRATFERVGRFPEIALMEDVALSAALRRCGPPLCLPQRVSTSGRRWEKHGVLQTLVLMWTLRLAYWLGADPDWLASCYVPNRHS